MFSLNGRKIWLSAVLKACVSKNHDKYCGFRNRVATWSLYPGDIIIIIITIMSLFREDYILSNTNYLSDICSSMIKIMYLNYRQICTIYTYTI